VYAKTRFSQKLSNLEVWSLLTTNREVPLVLFKDHTLGLLGWPWATAISPRAHSNPPHEKLHCRKIYARGGGLLVAPIIAPHLLFMLRVRVYEYIFSDIGRLITTDTTAVSRSNLSLSRSSILSVLSPRLYSVRLHELQQVWAPNSVLRYFDWPTHAKPRVAVSPIFEPHVRQWRTRIFFNGGMV